jgi:hypothetical protein
MLVDVIHDNHDAILEFVFGCNADAAQDRQKKNVGKRSIMVLPAPRSGPDSSPLRYTDSPSSALRRSQSGQGSREFGIDRVPQPWSPTWRFSEEFFRASARSFQTDDWLATTVHCYRHWYASQHCRVYSSRFAARYAGPSGMLRKAVPGLPDLLS